MKKIYSLLLVTLSLMAMGCKQQQEKKTDMQFRELGNTGLMVRIRLCYGK